VFFSKMAANAFSTIKLIFISVTVPDHTCKIPCLYMLPFKFYQQLKSGNLILLVSVDWKKLPKIFIFFKKLQWQFLVIFFGKCQDFCNFLTVKWQFSGGSGCNLNIFRKLLCLKLIFITHMQIES